jgi:hypothetical protein
MTTRNSDTLADFVAYCEAHPTERFWQALRNWCGRNFIFVSEQSLSSSGADDTFYWEDRTSHENE